MISEFKSLKAYQYTRMDDAIFDRYKIKDSRRFQEMLKLIEDEKELNKIYKELTEKLKSKEFRRYRRIDGDNKFNHYIERDDFSIINEMINDGIVFKESDKLAINQAMKDTLIKFVDFLKDKGEFKRRHFEPISYEELDNTLQDKEIVQE
jgi:hypothetical protein